MNLYMRALGFSDMDSKTEQIFIRENILKAIKQNILLANDELKRAAVIIRVSESTGIYAFGRYENREFIYEYHHPFVLGTKITSYTDISVERHLDKESYAVVYDEVRTGITMIFYLQNVMDYLAYACAQSRKNNAVFDSDKRNDIAMKTIRNRKSMLSALSLGGNILFPISRKRLERINSEAEDNRSKMIAAAKKGDEQAIENLTLEDIDTYTEISNRIKHEDVFTIVNSTFMPVGVECDQYSVVGDILELSEETNIFSKEKMYNMLLECNNIVFNMVINKKDLYGEPKVGRRFKGQVWLQGTIKFDD